MAKVVLNVALSALKYEAMYTGLAKNLVASSTDGRKIQLPLSAFQRFVTHQGIYGFFEVEFDDSNKLISVTKVR
ncbi:DUF2835 domain-containing protein [Marinomonas sp. IMCC 4694]|uniref:DUF2835 domain-containing protein n=1 Tax=Marinomonas sp. IMCC 4694 TaxID=2605432 RepID=UPI0011E7E979|nr:DUF2835 domain-containing protein [Marinomonas sp. IMCC 4694]TYL47519.1 DUF2835 family protein [Marinomonas sp. IMCC 4694]